jgi:tRNA dimethylallyltransferase
MDQLITILGPTASGKTALAANLASHLNGEIISADSRQIYRGMDIGTGKDIGDYQVDGKQIPYHLIDILEPGTRYNVFEFMSEFTNSFNMITRNKKLPILCGGSGMYLDAVLRGYQMNKVCENVELREKCRLLSVEELVGKLSSFGPLHNISDVTDKDRLIRAIEIAEYQSQNHDTVVNLPKFNSTNFGISHDRIVLRSRITERLKIRLSEGMVDEIQELLSRGIKPEELIYYGLEYKFVTMYVIGQISYEDMFTQLNTAIHQFAKRQMTWYRRMEKKGVKIHWIDGSIDLNDKLAVILNEVNF